MMARVLAALQPWGDTTTRSSVGRFAMAVLVAGLIHLVLFLGVSFVFPPVGSERPVTRPLEILVQPRVPPPELFGITDSPARFDKLGTKPIESRLTAADRPSSRREAEPGRGLQPLVIPRPGSKLVGVAEILASRGRALATRTDRIPDDPTASESYPRRKAIGAGTREYKYASYLEAWQRKVEHVGNLNYPEAAKRRKLYGYLRLRVAIRADGHLEWVRVLRSSGSELLDKAAVGILELAAPFAPFPPAIRAETDLLEVTRTWRFSRSNRLGGEH